MTGPIAWLHGYTMSSRVWEPLWDLLPGRDHLAIDLPGHGSKATAPMPRSMSGWTDMVAAEMRAAGSTELVGLSFGSSIALQVAADHPDLVRRLVLAAPTLSGVPDDPAARAKYWMLAMRIGELGPGPDIARIWMSDPPRIFTGLREFPQRYAAMADIIAEHPFGELRSGAMATLSSHVQDAAVLERIRAEVLLIVGTDDMPQFIANTDTIAQAVPAAQVKIIEGAGHLPLLERPEVSAGLIAGFVGA